MVATNESPVVLTAVDVADLLVTGGCLSGPRGIGLPAGQIGEQIEQTHTESPEATVTTTADADVDQTTVMQTVATPKAGMVRTRYTRAEPGVVTSQIPTAASRRFSCGGYGIEDPANG